jgi:hypothetical protein
MAKTNTKSAIRIGAGLLVVLLLVLFGLSIQTYRNSRVHGKEASLKAGLFQMRDALDEYMARTGTCPDSLKVLEGGH